MTEPILPVDLHLASDLDEPGVLEPSALYPRLPDGEVPDAAVICFFPETVRAIGEHEGSELAFRFTSIIGGQPCYVREVAGRRVAFFFPEIGAPRAVMFLEEAIARGITRFVAVGSAGVLLPDLVMGHPVVVTSALRDEGTSAHYGAVGPVVEAGASGIRACIDALDAAGAPHETGRTWTTDGIYRETRSTVARRIEAGCAVVEMEASAFLAVAAHRGVELGQILFSADSLAGEAWDHRGWVTAGDAHEQVFWIAMDAAARLAAG
ncbi:nucleoside phosphorylase [Arsenicicoccus bolidensis]|uniref:nucleoside phosphorylase n=1 Tax=Arsenicicoccus bolidensis TaxID=229480 RepID=UPI0004247C03|nr:nucleoside phosphorylase [Arsenicicoccus bolidensis]